MAEWPSKKEKKLKPELTKVGYLRVLLISPTNERKHKSVHRLVAETFIPNPNKLPQVNHKDGNKLNNHISNLEWCDSTHNNRHALATGLRTGRKKGIRCKYKNKTYNSISEAARDLNLSNYKTEKIVEKV